MKIRVKNRKTMHDYIALHGKLKRLAKEKHIPENEIWIRKDVYQNPKKRKAIITHENVEINLIKRGIPYYKAHKIANQFEKNVKRKLRVRK